MNVSDNITSHRQVLSFGENQGEAFLNDVLKGLTANEKYLDSKYFYDAKGDELFQKIMQCEEYYPTRCELEILNKIDFSTGRIITTKNRLYLLSHRHLKKCYSFIE